MVRKHFLTLSLGFAASAALLAGPASAQDLLVLHAFPGTIHRYSPTLAAQGVFASPGINTTGIAVDAGGFTYISRGSNSEIRQLSPSGVDLGPFATFVSSPAALAFDASGNLYAATGSGGLTIRRFSPTGDDLGVFAVVPGDGSVGELDFDSVGNLYVSDRLGGFVRKFSPTGTDLGNFATGLNFPTGLAFDAADNLYVSESNDFEVRRFSAAGADLGAFSSSVGLPVDIDRAADGTFYVVDGFGGLRQLSATGDTLNFTAITFTDSPNYMVILPAAASAAPEPGTLALLALPLLGVIARRRKR